MSVLPSRDQLDRLDKLRHLVNEQAEDEALWALNLDGSLPISEAYLQQELRRLHEAVEQTLPAFSAAAREAANLRAVQMEPEALARLFHETYERLAPSFGYETRKASAVPWESVPLMNKRLMVAVATEVLAALAAARETAT